jgi:uracil-DNA glycosylase
MTNLVKCGLNDDKNHFRGISHYNTDCIKNCYNTILKREIDIHQPSVIFAVGSTVEWWLKQFLPKGPLIQQLPHPAGRRRGFRDEHYKVLYFWLVVHALFRVGILKEAEITPFANLFLNNYSTR